jgi:hypothetical protein
VHAAERIEELLAQLGLSSSQLTGNGRAALQLLTSAAAGLQLQASGADAIIAGASYLCLQDTDTHLRKVWHRDAVHAAVV